VLAPGAGYGLRAALDLDLSLASSISTSGARYAIDPACGPAEPRSPGRELGSMERFAVGGLESDHCISICGGLPLIR